MEDQNMSLDFGESKVIKQTTDPLYHTAEYVALLEEAEERMSKLQEMVERTLSSHQTGFDTQLLKVEAAITKLDDALSATGIARFKRTAKETLQLGDEHLKALHLIIEKFHQQSHESLDRLDRASSYTIKNISEAVGSFHIDDFKNLTTKSCESLEKLTRTGSRRILSIVKWLYWKSICVGISACLITSLALCFYINDQWPWEMHHEAKFQREAGQALINAWPHLTEAEKTHIHSFKNNS